MTRKDYIKIADIIIETKAYNNVNFIVSLQTMLKDDNPNFDADRFDKYIADQVKEV